MTFQGRFTNAQIMTINRISVAGHELKKEKSSYSRNVIKGTSYFKRPTLEQTSIQLQGGLLQSSFFFFPQIKSLLNLLQYCFCFVLVFWCGGMWDLSFLTRDWTPTSCMGRWGLNHWIDREAPKISFKTIISIMRHSKKVTPAADSSAASSYVKDAFWLSVFEIMIDWGDQKCITWVYAFSLKSPETKFLSPIMWMIWCIIGLVKGWALS